MDVATVSVIAIGLKTCIACQQAQPLSGFRFEPRVRSKTTARCHECLKIQNREWAKANPEKVRTARLKSQEKHSQKWADERRHRMKEKRKERRAVLGIPPLLPRLTDDGRLCTHCRRRKPTSEFPPDASRSDSLSCYCRPCLNYRMRQYSRNPRVKAYRAQFMRHYDLRKYGLTIEQFETIVASQNSRCAICSVELEFGTGGCGVDHNHATKKVRGVLCRLCNVGIGHFREDAAMMLKAIDYLRRSNGTSKVT